MSLSLSACHNESTQEWETDGSAEAFGVGLDSHVLEAYTFLASNYEPDDEIFLFGFSRGAFTVRAIASFICNVSPLDILIRLSTHALTHGVIGWSA